jgi:hypothetical protein
MRGQAREDVAAMLRADATTREAVVQVPDEDHSTGTSWRAPRPQADAALPPHLTPCTRDEQAEHFAELAAAIADFHVGVALRSTAGRPTEAA